MIVKQLAFGLLASVALFTPAHAAVIVDDFTLDEGAFGSGLGVHSTGTQEGTTLSGVVNQDGSAVTFASTGVLTINGSGQATVVPLSGIIEVLSVNFARGWDNVTFSFSGDPGTFNLVVNGGAAFTAGGNCSICTIGSGQNKFTLSGSGITSLAFTFDPGVSTARQFRVDGVSNVPAVPEPATWAMMLLGFGFVGGAMRATKRRQSVAVSYT
jgi:hypothetical protein